MNKFFLFSLIACFAQVSASDIIMVRDYYSMLQAVPNAPQLYSDEMAADPHGCGIMRTETETSCDYNMVAGMEDQPMKGVTPWQQEYYEHWVTQGRPQGVEKELTAPLMMFGRHETGDQNGAEERYALEVEQERREEEARRNRAATAAASGSSSSNFQRSGLGMPSVQETPNYLQGIHFGSFDDDISMITDNATIGETTAETSSHSPLVSPSDKRKPFDQAQDRLEQASQVAANHVEWSLAQWKASKNLELAKKEYEVFATQFYSTKHAWENANNVFQAAEAQLRGNLQNQNPAWGSSAPLATAEAAEVQRTFQEHQRASVALQLAYQRYLSMGQRATQWGVIEGVKYGELLESAQQAANKAAEDLKKYKEGMRLIKFEKPPTATKSQATSPKSLTTSIQQRQAVAATATAIVEREASTRQEEQHDSFPERGPMAKELSMTATATATKETSHQDQATQIFKEDLDAWEREVFLKKSTAWKCIFDEVVKQLRQDKKKFKQAKEEVVAEGSRQLLNEILGEGPKKLVNDVVQATLAEEQILAERAHAATVLEATRQKLLSMLAQRVAVDQQKQAALRHEVSHLLDTMVPTVDTSSIIEEQLSKEVLSSAKEEDFLAKKERIFYKLFSPESEAAESKKSDQWKEITKSRKQALEQARAEMKKFCEEHMNLLHPPVAPQPAPTLAETIAPYVESTGNFLRQCYQCPYRWGRDTLQFLKDQQIVLVETQKETRTFFAAKGVEVADVPTVEYAKKYTQIAQRIYAEVLAERNRKETAREAAERERRVVSETASNPHKELGYLEQLPLMFEGPVFKRLLGTCVTGKIVDLNRECDARAMNYFAETGKLNPRIFEFWKKATEIQKQLEQERLEKAKELMDQYPDDKEAMIRVAQAWGAAWPERLKAEQEQRAVAKENARLEAERLAEEAKRQAALEEARLAREEAERKRAGIEKELLEQEQRGKSAKKNNKKGKSKK